MNISAFHLLRWLVWALGSALLAGALPAEAAACRSNTSGNWSASFTWNNCNGTVPQAGDSVTIRNGHTVTLNTDSAAISALTVNSGTTLRDDGNSRALNLRGNLVNNGSITLVGGSTSRISLQGASDWSGSGTVALTYLDVNYQTLTLGAGTPLVITLSGAIPIQGLGNFNNVASPNNTATVYLNGAAQTVPVGNIKMPNLQVGGGVKTVDSGTLLTIAGSLTIDSGATFDAQTNSIPVTLAGDLTINGTLRALGTGTWTFNGASAQTISAAATFRSVTLSNANGLTLGGDMTLGDGAWGTLTLNSGKLATGSYSVIVPRDCSTAWLSRTAGAWVNGNVKLYLPTWGTTCTFPVGDAYNYAPITFTYPWHVAPLGGNVTGSTTNGDHIDTVNGFSGISASKSVNRYWTLAADSGATFYTYDATFSYCTAASGADCTLKDTDSAAVPSSFIIAEKSSGSWSSLTATTSVATPRGSSQSTGLTNFGVFAIGNTGSSCSQPSNTPAGLALTCQCDSFGRATLNPSTMFTSSNWTVSTSDSTGVVPYINTSTGFLRLTENTGNNAKAATVPGYFPAAGNYISVEFRHYAYGGGSGGADGIAVTLSDYTVPAVPGAYGGSLGYAQKTGINGFAGGWLGVAIDEFGNFSANTEGRVGGYTDRILDSVSVRGSGSGTSGYPYLAGTGASLSPGIDTASTSMSVGPGYWYQVIVDARNAASGSTLVAVNRDTSSSTGGTYGTVVASFDAFARARASGYTQAAVPANWQLSLTGSTGGSTNVHEIGAVRICASSYISPNGGTANNFNAIDDFYTSSVQNFLSGHIFTKLVGKDFKLKVAALSDSQIQTGYAASTNKNVTLKLVDNSDNACGSDTDRAALCSAAACSGKTAVATQTLTFSAANKGIQTSAAFNLSKAYANLVAVMTDGSATGCSTDSFSVRPTSFSSMSSSATNAALTGTPVFKAGTDSFTLSATTAVGGYTGTPKIAVAGMTGTAAAYAVGTLSPTTFPAATAGSSTSTATGTFTYSEVGNIRFLGYNPASDTTSARGVYDDTWTAVDSDTTKNDCLVGSYSNTLDASTGKYGCAFGLYDTGSSTPNSALFGRFIPDHFTYVSGAVTPACNTFTYMGQPALGLAYTLEARSGSNGVTSNYSAALGYPVTSPAVVAEDQAAANQGCDLASRLSGIPSSTWVSGVYTVSGSAAMFSRPTAPGALNAASCSATKANAGGPFWLLDVGVQLKDGDGITLANNDMDSASSGACASCTAKKVGSTAMLDGRLWLNNAYGSEMLPLTVPVRTQYWTANGWVQNTADSCTLLKTPTSTNGGLVFSAQTPRNQLAAGETTATVNGSGGGTGVVSAGDGKLVLSAPGKNNYGVVDIVSAILAGNGSPALSTWLPPSTTSARACFGTCGPRSPIIYLRERF